jgi:hypothetical protein
MLGLLVLWPGNGSTMAYFAIALSEQAFSVNLDWRTQGTHFANAIRS